ncbi:Mitogen-activated protein kinase 10 [Diplonema papillatum]|nr:Mitogen-activated protein kinase 10 [Diplonema papillatum]
MTEQQGENSDLAYYNVGGHAFAVPSYYKLEAALGNGAFGVVSSAINAQHDPPLACAIKKVTSAFRDLDSARKLVRELRLLQHFSGHPNIISLLDVVKPTEAEYDSMYLVTDLLETDLARLLKGVEALSMEHIQYFLSQILSGLDAIHQAKVLHRDLKPENIFVKSTCELKIGDFGLARDGSHPAMSEYVVTRWWRSPELLLNWGSGKYDYAIDIWSVGCIFAEMLSTRHTALFPGEHTIAQLHRVLNVTGTPADEVLIGSENARKHIKSLPKTTRADLRQYRRPGDKETYWPEDVPDTCMDFVHQVLQFDPSQRPTAATLRRHPCLGDYVYDSEEDEEDEFEVHEFSPVFEDHMKTVGDAREIANATIAQYHPDFLNVPNVKVHPKISAVTYDVEADDTARENTADLSMYDAASRSALASQTVELLDTLSLSGASIETSVLNKVTQQALQGAEKEGIEQAVQECGLVWEGEKGFTSDLTEAEIARFRCTLGQILDTSGMHLNKKE